MGIKKQLNGIIKIYKMNQRQINIITGGTGSLGKALTKYIFLHHPDVKKVVIYSRDEQKQFQMAQEFPEEKYPQIEFFIGDVARDEERINGDFRGIDYVIHAAAESMFQLLNIIPMSVLKQI